MIVTNSLLPGVKSCKAKLIQYSKEKLLIKGNVVTC